MGDTRKSYTPYSSATSLGFEGRHARIQGFDRALHSDLLPGCKLWHQVARFPQPEAGPEDQQLPQVMLYLERAALFTVCLEPALCTADTWNLCCNGIRQVKSSFRRKFHMGQGLVHDSKVAQRSTLSCRSNFECGRKWVARLS